MSQRKQQGKNPKELKKQPKEHGNPHPTAYQQERAKATTPRRKDKRAQG